eukprot:scaffold34087_cov62-Isochrysis_galbana.AAC.1
MPLWAEPIIVGEGVGLWRPNKKRKENSKAGGERISGCGDRNLRARRMQGEQPAQIGCGASGSCRNSMAPEMECSACGHTDTALRSK